MVFLFVVPISMLFLWGNRKVKYNKLFLILLLIMVIIMGGSIENPDTGVYYDLYYAEELFTKDILFGVLMAFFKWCGLNVDEFRLVICLIALCLLYTVVFRFTQSPFIFTALYISYQFFYDVVQLRNFLGISVMVFGLALFYGGSRKQKFISLLLMVCSILIQKTHLVIPVFMVVTYLIKKSKAIKYIVIAGSIGFGILCLSNSVMDMVSYILNNIELSGLSSFTERVTNLGWMISWVIHFANCAILYYIKTIMFSKLDDKQYSFMNAIYYINLSGTICLFLYIINPTFGRILRNITILDFLIISYYFSKYLRYFNVKNRNMELILEVATISIYCIVLFVLIHVYSNTLEWIADIFQYNWILFGGASYGQWLP